MLFASPSLAFVLTFILTGGPPAPAIAQPAPPTGLTFPHDEPGACPFECCAYGRWQATSAVAVRRARAADAPVAFRVAAGEAVEALTGVVVTTRPGRARAVARLVLDGVPVQRGQDVAVLHRVGEGEFAVWVDGRVVHAEMDSGTGLRLLAEPRTVWWVRIRNAHGETGWSDEPDRFGGRDRCS